MVSAASVTAATSLMATSSSRHRTISITQRLLPQPAVASINSCCLMRQQSALLSRHCTAFAMLHGATDSSALHLQGGVEPVARRDADGRLAPTRRAADAAYGGDLTLPRLSSGGAGGYGARQHETYGPVTGHSGPTHGAGALAAQYSHNVHAESQQYARYGPKRAPSSASAKG